MIVRARPAAFFRLEGALHPASSHEAAAYLAANAASMRRRLFGVGGVALAAVLRRAEFAGVEAIRLSHAVLAGCSRDRIEVLSEDYARDVLIPETRPSAIRLLAGARRDGLVTVLLSESIKPIAEAFSRFVLDEPRPAFDILVANDLEYDDRGRTTGKLLDPVVGPEIDPKRLRAIAAAHAIDLERSRAYGHTRSDLVLLSAVGHPCAVEPDRELARAAHDLDWPAVRDDDPRASARRAGSRRTNAPSPFDQGAFER